MAYDPQARKQSNSALIFGLIALLVVGGAALAYFATRPGPETGPTTVISPVREKETVVVGATPAPQTNTTIIVAPTAAPALNDAPDTVIIAPPASGSTKTETTTSVRNTDPAPRAPVASPPADSQSKTTVNNTIINPPAPSANAGKARPIQPDSSDTATNAATPDVAANAASANSNTVEGY